MSRRGKVYVTANFERDLASLERFLLEQETPDTFAALLSRLFEVVIPNLEEFLEMGPDFLARHPQSMDGLAQWKALQRRLGPAAQIREYFAGEYLVLYAVQEGKAYLLALKHHKQLSFDLRGHW